MRRLRGSYHRGAVGVGGAIDVIVQSGRKLQQWLASMRAEIASPAISFVRPPRRDRHPATAPISDGGYPRPSTIRNVSGSAMCERDPPVRELIPKEPKRSDAAGIGPSATT